MHGPNGNGEKAGASSAPVFAAARPLAARGWAVFPCDGKRPRTDHGLHDATTDQDKLDHWQQIWPDANIGLSTGDASGVFVVDVDGEDGADTLHELELQHGELPATVEALTGRGRHVYFKHPGKDMRNTAGKLGAGLDTRGDGGYVIAPPSTHENGRMYMWVADHGPDDVELAELPGWLAEQLSRPAPSSSSSNGSVPDEAVLEGARNAHLASLAGSMRKRGMTPDAIAAALQTENELRCRPPLNEREVNRIAESVGRYAPDATASETFTVEVLNAKAICALPDPPLSDELLGPLVTRGSRLVIGAHTGEGKTTITLQVVRAISTRGPFLDWTGAGGRALIIDAEQGLKTIKRRLHEAGLHESEDVDYIRVPDGLSLDTDERHVAAIEEVLADGDYALIVADPLYKLHTGDSNDERAAVDLMRRFDAWREQYRFAFVLPVHCRKPPIGAKFTMHEFFGSTAYLRGAEVVLGLQRIRDGYGRLHFFKDRDGDLSIGAKWGLLFDREQGFRRDPDDETPKRTAAEQVRELLEQQPGLTIGQLVKETGYAERTIRKALKDIGAEDTRPGDAATDKLWTVEDNPE